MKSVTQYLDDLKEITGSDYASAKQLNVTKEAVSKIRKRGQLSDETALKMAAILNIDSTELLIAAAIARSEGDTKKAWIKAAQKFSLVLSIVLLTKTLMIVGRIIND